MLMMKKVKKISTKISIYFALITLFVGVIFYFLLPNLLNYPPDTINSQFDKEVSKLYYIYQYAIAVIGIITIFIIFFKISLKKIDTWVLNKDKSKVEEIRNTCFQYPFKLFVTIEIFPVLIVLLTLMATGSHPVILLFKIGILVFSFATLVSSIFLIISKNVFYPILKETSQYAKDTKSEKKDSLVTRLTFQIFPSILVSILLVALIGYSRLTVEKGNLLNTYYMAELQNVTFSSSSNLLGQLENQLNDQLLSENDFVFIETPSGEILTNHPDSISDFFIKYMHVLSSSHDNRVYEAYTIDEQGVINQITFNGQTYTIGIHYEIVSSSLLTYFLLASGLLFIFNLIMLTYMIKSINSDLNNVTDGMKNILKNKNNLNSNKLPVTSNDIVGELVKSFNSIQDLTKENIDKIHDNQNMLMERERLASLGQLIGGIAHNLKTPIMSISGAAEGLNDLVNEFDASIGNPIVNNDDFHDIAKDMRDWLEKVKSYTEYMSDILTAVKGQAVTLSNDEDISFSIGELFKRVNILMKHELKKSVVYLNVSMKVDENLLIHGNVNSLVQVINNMISNSIQAYNGKPEQTIDLIASQDQNHVIITVKDYGSGLPKKVQNKLFKEMITTKGKNGTGLGLYMSYSTIKAHFNGDITIETEEDKGTSFNIILPL
jgi:signal transduction histidine kinase